tara:strand:- start:1285 stop:1959 length:675 start_codon:yes stop_codon:yes gene_type:complete
MSYSYEFEITNGTQTGGSFTWDGSVSAWNAFANDEGFLTATGQSKATFNLNPPGATGTSPGRFRPGVSGVANLPDQDIDVGGEPSSSAHIVFTNNEWTTSHGSSGYVWKITRTATGSGSGTGTEGSTNPAGTVVKVGTSANAATVKFTISGTSPSSSGVISYEIVRDGVVTSTITGHTAGTDTETIVGWYNSRWELRMVSTTALYETSILAFLVKDAKVSANFW